jgi:hypothetical protein
MLGNEYHAKFWKMWKFRLSRSELMWDGGKISLMDLIVNHLQIVFRRLPEQQMEEQILRFDIVEPGERPW